MGQKRAVGGFLLRNLYKGVRGAGSRPKEGLSRRTQRALPTMAGGSRAAATILLLVAGLLPAALALPTTASDGNRHAARVMRVGTSSNSKDVKNNNNNDNSQDSENNYSVSFVPLFSLIANFLPKLLSRFAIKPPGSRSLDQKEDESKEFFQSKGIFCGPGTIGRWKDISNCHQFYECTVKPDSPPGCQTVLSRNSGKHTEDTNLFVKSESPNINEETVPVLLEYYNNSCVTVTTYKCQTGHIYNDSLKQCVAQQSHVC